MKRLVIILVIACSCGNKGKRENAHLGGAQKIYFAGRAYYTDAYRAPVQPDGSEFFKFDTSYLDTAVVSVRDDSIVFTRKYVFYRLDMRTLKHSRYRIQLQNEDFLRNNNNIYFEKFTGDPLITKVFYRYDTDSCIILDTAVVEDLQKKEWQTFRGKRILLPSK